MYTGSIAYQQLRQGGRQPRPVACEGESSVRLGSTDRPLASLPRDWRSIAKNVQFSIAIDNEESSHVISVGHDRQIFERRRLDRVREVALRLGCEDRDRRDLPPPASMRRCRCRLDTR